MGLVKRVMFYLLFLVSNIFINIGNAQEYGFDDRSFSEHIRLAVKMIKNLDSSKCVNINRSDFDFIEMQTLNTKAAEPEDSIGYWSVAWEEYQSLFEVVVFQKKGLFKTGEVFYGFITIDKHKLSKGLLVRTLTDELYYVKLINGFTHWLDDPEALTDSTIVNNVEAIYSLSADLKPVNISRYENGSQRSVNLNDEIYYLEKDCDSITSLLSWGFHVLPLFLDGLECAIVSHYEQIEKYKDWLAYYEFEPYLVDWIYRTER